MFIDSKPASVYSHTSDVDVAMPRLRRPPAVMNNSSSSLSPLEKSIPSFQAFVKRNPSPNQNKPLPPVPYSETLRSSPKSTRRSSSVYSRTVSQWAPTPESWKRQDVSSSTLFLQPSVYSLSTPELTLDKPSGMLLPPRTYAPLIASPSPSPSRKSTPSPPREKRPSALLPPPLPMLRIATNHIRTVSLDKAKAALRSPGVQPLLPEELRALAAAKKAKESILRSSHSFEGVVPMQSPTSYSSLSPNQYPDLLPTGSDWPLQAKTFAKQKTSKLSDDYFGTSANSRIALVPVEEKIREPSIYVTRDDESMFETEVKDYEDRGRGRVKSYSGSNRKSRGAESRIENTLPKTTNKIVIAKAQRLAEEYHEMLQNQGKSPTKSMHSASSASVKEAMKLVPQPLFFNPRAISKQRIQQYQRNVDEVRYSPMGRSTDSRPPLKTQPSSPASQERVPRFPFKLSLTPESTGMGTQRRNSSARSGSIPISPPFSTFPTRFNQSPDTPRSKKSDSPSMDRKLSIDDSYRFSAFYHRINQDAENLAQKQKPPNGKLTWDLTQQVPNAFSPTNETDRSRESNHRRKPSDGSAASSIASVKAPLVASVQKGIAAVTSVFGHHGGRRRSITTDTSESPKRQRPSFPIISAPQPIVTDNSQNLASKAQPIPKRPSLFAGIRDQRRESRANKRREELKKTIKVIPSSIPEFAGQHTGHETGKGSFL